MKQSELFALNHYLSFFPENESFDEVLTLIENEDESVGVWEPFENYPVNEVVDFISHMASSVEEKFYPVLDLVCIIDRETIKEMAKGYIDRDLTAEELEKIARFIDSDFSYQLSEKVSDAVTYCEIKA